MILKDAIDVIFSRYERINIYKRTSDGKLNLVWKGMAYEIPDKYKYIIYWRVFGMVSKYSESDIINIWYDEYKNERGNNE